MKTILQYLSTLSLILSVPFMLHAQVSTTTTTPGYYTFGLNAGWSYQSSDIRATDEGFGVGLTLGKNLYYRPGAPIALDLRGRLLYAQQYGLDPFRTYSIADNDALNGENALDYLNYPTELSEPKGFVFQNHRTDVAELGLEGVITLNSLKEETGFLAAVYGGIGLDWYLTRLDQANAQGLEYYTDYSRFDASRPKGQITRDLRQNVLDGNYETTAETFGEYGKLGIMPSVGLELGYQFGPHFALTAGHRVTFSRTDQLDGHQWEDLQNDLYHYSTLGLQWTIPNQRRVKVNQPQIDIIQPNRLPFTTQSSSANVRARIRYINSAADVNVSVNGRPVNFDFYNGDLNTFCFLDPGKNIAVITASNQHGTARKEVIIIYNQGQIITPPPAPPTGGNRPVVNIYNPDRSPYQTDQFRHVIRATIDNVINKNDVQFIVNGQSTRNFVFDSRRQEFTATVDLLEGRNEIAIRATNPYGPHEDGVIINQRPQTAPPTVRITVPTANPAKTDFPDADIRATIQGVGGKSDLTFLVNGTRSTNFTLYGNEFKASITLRPGNNRVSIQAQNAGGTERDEVTILFQPAPPPVNPPQKPPRIEITSPTNQTQTEQEHIDLRASLQNVASKTEIQLTLNGSRIDDFIYSGNTLSARLVLKVGANTIKIAVRTTDGQDQDQVTVNYRPNSPPSVTIQRPANQSISPDPQINFSATVTEISQKSQITVTLNGQNQTSFNYRHPNVSGRLSLREGNNNLQIKVQNEDGSDEDKVLIIYQPPAAKPTIRFTRPARPGSTVRKSPTPITAVIEGVDGKDQLQFTVNDRNISNFSFDAASGNLTATVSLQEGSNTLDLTAANAGGKTSVTTQIIYEESRPAPTVGTKPVIKNLQIATPVSNPLNPNIATSGLSATIEGVRDQSQLSVEVNGEAVEFSFDRTTRQLTATLLLKRGTNTLVLTATNRAGSSQETRSISF